MLPGVFKTKKKNGTDSYRCSITHRGKHISLGSYLSEEQAHSAYLEAGLILFDNKLSLDHFRETCHILPFKKWVALINFRDNGIYIKTPIYMKNKFFLYYFSPDCYYTFDVDDLFYYSTHSIMKRGNHLFVSDYGMQVNILSRYGIRNFAVPGRDYLFMNGDSHDFRYENIQIINRFYGVTKKMGPGIVYYDVRLHVKGNLFVGRYTDEISAAIAYNKAITLLAKKGIQKKYSLNYIEELSAEEYHKIYKEISLSSKINEYQFRTRSYKES